jgi:hypothetical protein
LTVAELKQILKDDYSIKQISNKPKDWLICKLLEVRGEPNDDTAVTELKTWTENTVEVYTVGSGSNAGCKVGFVSRHLVNLYGDLLDGKYARIIKLRSLSEWRSERLESVRNGGSALAETVRLSFE